MDANLPIPGAQLRCGLAAHAAVRLSVDAIAALRSPPGPLSDVPLPVSTLKNVDEHTLTALVALDRARRQWNVPGPFTHWGVISAPRYLGRVTARPSLARFLAEGAWGVSPHIVPHRSLHSVSGILSQVLKLHGPNFGIGGSAGCEVEGLLATLTLLQQNLVEGVWLVLTRIEPELPPADFRPHPDASCQGIALALVPSRVAAAAGALEMTWQSAEGLAPFDYDQLENWLGQAREPLSVSLGQLAHIRLIPGPGSMAPPAATLAALAEHAGS